MHFGLPADLRVTEKPCRGFPHASEDRSLARCSRSCWWVLASGGGPTSPRRTRSSRAFRARRGVRRRAAAEGLSDGRRRPIHFPVTTDPWPSVLRPGRRPAARLLVLRGRAIVPPGRRARSRLRHGLLGHGDGEHRTTQTRAKGFIKEAPEASSTASRREQLWIDALELVSPSERRQRPNANGSTGFAAWRRSSRSSPTTSRPRRSWRW